MGKFPFSLCVLGAICTFDLSGCVFETIRMEPMPALIVKGRIVDNNGNGISGQEVRLYVPGGYGFDIKNYENDCDPEMKAIEFSNEEGAFIHHFPKWIKEQAGVAYFKTLEDHFSIGVKDVSVEHAYMLWVDKKNVEALRLPEVPEPLRELRESDVTKDVTATVQNRKSEMTVEFTIFREETSCIERSEPK